MIIFLVVFFALAVVLSYFLTFIFRRLALSLNILNHPSSSRYSKKTIPLLGGLAIFVSFWVSIALSQWSGFGKVENLIGVFWGGLILVVIGVIDDIKELNVFIKFCAQLAAAAILMKYGFAINFLYSYSIPNLCITFLWVLMIINAFNLVDSLDGLSAGLAVISAAMFLIVSLLQQNFVVSAVVIIFIGSVVGFLPWNMNPARIYMGDAGSMFLGYMLASITLMTSFYQIGENLKMAILTPLLVFAVPIYDTISVIVIRTLNKKPIYVGDINHFAYRLIRLGLKEKVAVYLAYLMAVCTGLTAILLIQVNIFGAIIILVIFSCVIIIVAVLEYYASRRIRFIELTKQKKLHRRKF